MLEKTEEQSHRDNLETAWAHEKNEDKQNKKHIQYRKLKSSPAHVKILG